MRAKFASVVMLVFALMATACSGATSTSWPPEGIEATNETSLLSAEDMGESLTLLEITTAGELISQRSILENYEISGLRVKVFSADGGHSDIFLNVSKTYSTIIIIEGSGGRTHQDIEETFILSISSPGGEEIFSREILPGFSFIVKYSFRGYKFYRVEAIKRDGSSLVILLSKPPTFTELKN